MSRASIEALYRSHAGVVLRRARMLLRDEQAAQDVLQEVFIKAIRAFSGFRGESSPATWLYQMTTNACLNYLRDGARRRNALARRLPPNPASSVSAPEDRVGIEELLRQLP